MKRIVMFVRGKSTGFGFNERNYDIHKNMEYFAENTHEAKDLMTMLGKSVILEYTSMCDSAHIHVFGEEHGFSIVITGSYAESLSGTHIDVTVNVILCN